MIDVMLDLETMGTSTDAAIVAIGAVKFGPEGITDRFSETVDLRSSAAASLKIDPDTVLWWMRQGDQARAQLGNGITLIEALLKFRDWLAEPVLMWGNGSDFDNPILANAYRVCMIPLPWKYYHNRCYRTMKGVFRSVRMDKLERVGTHHCAVDDAESQALHLIKIFKHIGRC